MVTKSQIDKLTKAIEQMAEASNPAIVVTIFAGETVKAATERHFQLRPDHRGRRLQFRSRPEHRDHVAEMLAAHTQSEIAATLEAITVANAGVPIGEQMLRDIARASANKPTEVDTIH